MREDSKKLKQQLNSIAGAIEELNSVGTAIKESELNHRAIVLLLCDMTGLNKTVISQVLGALPNLRRTYLKVKETAVEGQKKL